MQGGQTCHVFMNHGALVNLALAGSVRRCLDRKYLGATDVSVNQTSFLTVQVMYEVDSSRFFDGADLKRVARGDDGNDYAMKRLTDHPLLPISEWLGYRLFRACGLKTPDYAVLYHDDGQPPAFGSRIDLTTRQIAKDPNAFTVAGFFGPHLDELGRIYPMDAFLPNPDRHGRNLLKRVTLTGDELLCFDYSRASLVTGLPFGNTDSMNNSLTAQWWQHFRRNMAVQADHSALNRVQELPNDWIIKTLNEAPDPWLGGVDPVTIDAFWRNNRDHRIDFSKNWP